MRVVGRYPTSANECNVTWQPTLPPSDGDNLDTVVDGPAASVNNLTLDIRQPIIDRILAPLAYDNVVGSTYTVVKPSSPIPTGNFVYVQFPNQIDPFDYIPDNVRNSSADNTRYIEMDGLDTGPEIQRGYVFTGQHVVNDVDANGKQTFCLGSEWTSQKVEDLMNSPNFLQRGVVMPPVNNGNYRVTVTPGGTNGSAFSTWNGTYGARYNEWQKQAQYLPESQGLVLVEMFWSHTTLMDFPFMRPIVTMFGDPQRITISVWAAFPVPSIEPGIIYQLPK
jgi:hypothetical protein